MLDVPDNRKLLPLSPWTDEKVVRLKEMHATGHSYTEMGIELGVSRNAVGGKVDRLGLDKRERPKGAQRIKRANDGGALAQRLNANHSTFQRISQKLKVRQPSRGGVTEVNIVIRDEGPVPANFLCVALIDLDQHHCRFPRGGEDGEVISFCGQRKMDGESYCLAHHRIAYNAPKPIAPRPYLPLGGSKPRVI